MAARGWQRGQAVRLGDRQRHRGGRGAGQRGRRPAQDRAARADQDARHPHRAGQATRTSSSPSRSTSSPRKRGSGGSVPGAARPIHRASTGCEGSSTAERRIRSRAATIRSGGGGVSQDFSASSTAFPPRCSSYSSQDRPARVRSAMADDAAPAPRRPAPRGGRVPPHDLHAEESLLETMMLEAEAIATAAGVLRADDFYKPAHAHIFDAIRIQRVGPARSIRSPWPTSCRPGELLETVGGHQVLVDVMAAHPGDHQRRRLRPHRGGTPRCCAAHRRRRRDRRDRLRHARGHRQGPRPGRRSMVYDVNRRRVIDSTAKIEPAGAEPRPSGAPLRRGGSITGVPTGTSIWTSCAPACSLAPWSWWGPAVDGEVHRGRRAGGRPRDELRTAAQLRRGGHRGRAVAVLTLEGGRVVETQPSAFVDDGIKPVYRVRTSSSARSARPPATRSSPPRAGGRWPTWPRGGEWGCRPPSPCSAR